MSQPDTTLMTQGLASVQAANVQITVNGTQATLGTQLAVRNGGTTTNGTLAGTTTNSGTITGGNVSNAGITWPATDAISTAGSTQATATQLATQFANVATTTAGQGVNLQQEGPGFLEIVINSGTSGFTAYPVQGGTATVNSNAATLGVFHPQGAIGVAVATKAGAIEMGGLNPLKHVGYTADSNAAAHTVAATALTSGDVLSVVDLTGSLAAGAALTLPTVAQLLADTPWGNLNAGFVVRFMNHSAGAQSWTITSNGSFVTNGTSTVPQATFRDFAISFVNGTSAVAQGIGGGNIV